MGNWIHNSIHLAKIKSSQQKSLKSYGRFERQILTGFINYLKTASTQMRENVYLELKSFHQDDLVISNANL